MLTADSMTPPGLSADERLQLERRMLDLLIGGVRQVLLTSIVIGPMLTAWLTFPYIGPVKAMAPLLLLLTFGAERVFLLRRIARERALNDDTPRRWAYALGWRLILGSFVVVIWFHFAVQTGNRILIAQMLSLLTILAAGGAALFSSWPPVMWAVISSLLLGMAAQLALLGTPEHMVDATFCFVLWLVLASASLRSARTLLNEAVTRLHNEELVRALNEKNAAVEAANAARTRFFAAANHDLRQPLQAMNLYLGVLQPGEHDLATHKRISQCMSALDGLLESLLEVSRLDAGQFVLNLQTVPLQPVFDRLADMHEPMAHQKNLQLRVHATTAWTHTDPALLERALGNLLSNAIRNTFRDGVLLGVRRHGSGWRVCVMDTGIGIPEDARELIFEEFVQLNNPSRDGEQGHGLGLPTVRRIATLLGHPMGLRSHVNQGSTFWLDLPNASAQPDQVSASDPQRHAPKEAAALLRGRVLVVEDNELVRDALVQQLTSWGLEVQTAHNGEVARSIISNAAEGRALDGVLSDWRLPGSLDGLAVLREARMQLPQLRFSLLVTGEDVRQLHQCEPEFPVVRKPIRALQLRAILIRHLASVAPDRS